MNNTFGSSLTRAIGVFLFSGGDWMNGWNVYKSILY